MLFTFVKALFTSKEKTAFPFIFALIPIICSIHLLKNYSQIKENINKNYEGLY